MNNKYKKINNLSSDEKRKLLADLMQKKTAKSQLFPLSFAQSRLWFLDKLDSGSAAYNLPVALNLSGKLDIAVLEKSLNKIVRRHEILKTCFIEVKDEPFQKILPSLTISLNLIDLQNLLPQQQKTQVQEYIKLEALKTFDLTQVPLFRCQLLNLGKDEYVLLFTMHHIISDYWSMRVLIQELAIIYQGNSASLPDLPIQYVDYAVWQKQWLEKEAKTTQLAYWKKQLEGHPSVLQLPTDFPRPSVPSFRGATHYFTLSTELSESLKTLSRREGVTLFMTLLAAFKILLYRYTSQEDILVGSTIANRNRPELENLIGLLVNNLVFRSNLSGNPRFIDFLQQVRETTLNAYTHQDLPYEYLVKELQLERDLSYNPLFQVMFILHNTPSQTVQLPNFTLKYITPDSQTARFDLSLDMSETPTGLTGMFEYNTDLFKSETINRLIGHFQTLLAGIIAHPEQRLSELPLLTLSEEQLLSECNNTKQRYQQICFHQLFEEQVERTPDNIAIVFENQSLTYRELNVLANQLAHYLQKQGVKSETLVGICIERSLEMVIGLLGILKAGGVYLPLDPTYPQERLDYIIQDARVSILLTRSGVRNWESGVGKIICIDNWEIIEQENQDNLNSQVTPENLAYIIYTSGSTGKPKGVQIPQSALINFLFSMQEKFQPSQTDNLLSVTTLSFDIAALELYLPLMVGAKVVLVSREVATDGHQLLEKLNDITVMQATPATWRLLLSVGWQGNTQLKILCGGEALDNQLARQLLERGKEVWNLYGPTETTIWSSVYQVTSSSVLIGHPIANTQFHVLDTYLQPVPIGVPGELYIGGLGLARGYFNRPDLTAERFIPNPFAKEEVQKFRSSGVQNVFLPHPLSRLYRTGDKVRYLSDGNIEYLGRFDNQVKIRGFRIELGEIETVLNQNPDIEKAVVIVREDEPNEKRLVAYLISEKSPDLRSFLEDKLPQYMIPASFVSLDAFPLTPNGKIDLRSLPIPNSIPSKNLSVIPRTPTEEILLSIWQQVLNLEHISIHDNFFALGGHSLLATKVISQIRQSLSLEIPLRFLFEASTIAKLAKKIEATQLETLGLDIPPIARTDETFLSPAQQRQWFLAQLEPDSPFYNIPAAIRLQGQLDITLLKESFDRVIQRHEVLRTAFHTVEGQPVAVISPKIELNLSVIDIDPPKSPLVRGTLSEFPPYEEGLGGISPQVTQYIQKEIQIPFNLDELPLFRVKICCLSPEEYIILLTMHHIISDAWSIGILVHEVATLYHGSTLSDLPIQYRDYAAWQREVLQGRILETQLAYWKKQLQNAPTVLELPTDYQRPAIQTFRGDTVQFQISSESTKSLKTFTQQQGCTVFMTLLAVFQTLLYRYTSNEDIIVGSPIANRNRTETEGLIGFFVNTLVLRTNLSGNPTFETLLQRIKEITLNAYAHQDIPFEQLVDELQLPRDLSYTPLFQVMFVLQNTPIQTLNLSGLTWTPLKTQSSTAKFDLTLYMTETEEGFIGTFEYNTDLFKKATIQRMIGHFQTLLAAILTHPQQHLSELPLLTQSEKQQLLEGWNNTKAEYTHINGLHQLFEAQVRQTSNEIAVIVENQQLTYQELNQQANQLAHYLQTLGVKPEDKIGICSDRTFHLIIGLLGILKTGAAYVPLDPTYPPERLAFTIKDAGCSIILTQQKFSETLSLNQAQVIYLDTDWEKIALESKTNSINLVTSDNLAYIIYTSGSTGKPKGVAITHHSAVSFIHWAKNTFTDKQLKGILASTSICFDLSVFEIFLPLSCGGTVVLAENALDLPNISAKVTLINTVPSAATELLRIDGIPESVITVNLAGEALSNQLVGQLYQKSHIQQVYNLYGPSEDTTYSTYTLTSKDDTHSPTIGRPITNTQTYILDRYLNPVPIGVPGELYLGGEGLARGYLNRPKLTADKFIPHPFKPSQRLYKTGDLAKYRPEGNIEYLGRLDNQVKIRGFRIELGEIEANLLQNPEIIQAVVNPWVDDTGNKRLVAYLVTSYIPQDLRNFLKTKLPEYMIPSIFIPLKTLPLTPNGKIDRKSLPHPQLAADNGHSDVRTQVPHPCPPQKGKFVKPFTEIEKQLAQIWSQLLGIEQIGIYDNFFELGGDSILAIQAIAKVNQIGLQLTPKLLFKHQTIAELASVVGTPSIQAEQGIVTGFVPLTPIQQWFFEQNLIDAHYWNQSILLEVGQALNPTLLEQAIQKVSEHHDALRLRFEQTETGWQQNIASLGQSIPFTYHDLSEISNINLEIEKIANQLQASFNLSVEPLLRIAFFNLGENRTHRLLLIVHHLIIDGVSWRILLEDLQNAYHQLNQGKTVQLPPKTTSFKEWSERKYTPSDLNYWLDESRLQITPLPVDFRDGKNTMSEAQTISVRLTPAETQQLLQDVPAVYHTQINDVLLTAIVKTFARWTGKRQLLLELEGHGREEIYDDVDISRTIGWFTTLFPLLLDLENTDNLGDALKSVKEQLRKVPMRGFSYGMLCYRVDESIQEKLQAMPQAEIRFNYLGQSDQLFTQSSLFSPASESSGLSRSPRNQRDTLIEINGMVTRGQLQINWTYSEGIHHQRTIASLTQNFLNILRELIQHCLSTEAGGYTPSDFPQMDFTQTELDELLDELI